MIDFGSATLDSDYHTSIVSTRNYRAPEVILGTLSRARARDCLIIASHTLLMLNVQVSVGPTRATFGRSAASCSSSTLEIRSSKRATISNTWP